MLLRPRTLPAGFVAPCLPTTAPHPPSGEPWLHEIKHDGFRVIARKNGHRVKLYSRPGNDLTARFPLIVETLGQLRPRSCIIDGEAVACGDDGIALFERIRYRRFDSSVFMYAFDLIELNGDDLRREPLEWRKAALERLLARAGYGVQLNEHLEAEGPLCSSMRVGWASKDRVEAQGLVVQLRALAGLVEGEEPEGAGSDAIG